MAISKVIYKSSSQDTGTVWMDATPATAAAADITAPKTAMLADGVLTTGTGSGGGSVTVEEKDVNFIDYDGTIVASYTASDFASLSALPANPSHSGLTAQGWNWSLSDAKTYVASYGKLWIGQMYVTDDGKTRIYIHLDNPDFLSPYLAIAINGTVVVDWGDGSSTDTMTGTSLTTQKYQLHEYAGIGDYTITLNPTSGSFAFYSPSSSNPNILKSKGTYGNYATSSAYAVVINRVEVGASVVIGDYAFNYLYNLESITIPKAVTSIGKNAFYYCRMLKSATVPDAVASIGDYAFYYCGELKYVSFNKSQTVGTYAFNYNFSLHFVTLPYTNQLSNYFFNYSNISTVVLPNTIQTILQNAFAYCSRLASIYLPNSITSIGNSAFSYCASLKSIHLPENLTSIGNSVFASCNSLRSLTIPATVTSIGNSAFSALYDMKEYHFLPQTPPTLGTTAFSGIQSGTIIYVPRGKLTAYQTASNWSTYASYMQEEPA